ncbi:MAG: sugar phosphate nucleotidyltransferase [Candidatus Bathyarchaeia archaeon]
MLEKALILAAGEGERLEDLTENKPKPLVSVAGSPLLCRVLKSLKLAGIAEAYIVVGYMGYKIRKTIGHSYAGVRVHYIENQRWREGNLYSLLVSKEVLKEDFILCMADHLFDSRIVKALQSKNPKNSLVLAVDRKTPLPDDTKVLEKNGKIVEIGKSIERSNCVDTGFFLCSPRIFDYAERAAEKGMGELADGVRLAALEGEADVLDISELSGRIPKLRKEMKPYWIDVDTKEDVKRAKEMLVEKLSKSPSDLLACYVHRPIENKIVYHLSGYGITPNQMTVFVNIVAYTVTFLFLTGNLLPASILTFVVGLMDGLDGKLARVKDMTSELGSMEHPFDALYEFSWIAAISIHLSLSAGRLLPVLLGMLIILLTVFYRQCYDRFRMSTGKSLDAYGKFDRIFRRIVGRRNLYNIHIFVAVILGVPLYCLVSILLHAAMTTIVYACRACLHLHTHDKAIQQSGSNNLTSQSTL